MPEVLLASNNPKKLAEMQRILGERLPDVTVLGLGDVASYDEPVEDAPHFAGNALLKARAGLAASGIPTVADDSGLCVDALNGMPGVLSARWSGTLSPHGARTTPRTTGCSSTSSPTSPTSAAAPSSAVRSRSATPTGTAASPRLSSTA